MNYVCTHKKRVKIKPIGTPSRSISVVDCDCGKCRACRLKRRNQWATRLALQWKDTPNALWCLFTYNNEHIPAFNRLGKERMSAFIKRLRRWFEYHWNWKGIKFFCSGEYGTINNRPHFHVILFNLPICNKNKICLSIKYQLELLWKQGYVKVKKLETINQVYYCAKYAVKGLSEHEDVEPCILFSKGLGKDFVKKNLAYFKEQVSNVLDPKSPKVNVDGKVFFLDSVKMYKKLIYTDEQLKSKLYDYLLSVSKDITSYGVMEKDMQKYEWSKHAEKLVNQGITKYKELERRK